MRLRRALVLTAVAAILLACSWIYSLDGLEGQPPTVADAGDAATSRPGDAATSNTGDAATSDAGDAGTWCQSQVPATFCVDFDEGDPVGYGWEVRQDHGVVALDCTRWHSSPCAAHMTQPQPQTCVYNSLVKRFAGPSHELHLGLSVWVGTSDDGGASVDVPMYVNFAGSDGGNPCEILLGPGTTYPLTIQSSLDGGNAWPQMKRFIVPGQWTQLEVALVADSGVPVLSVDIDGQNALPPTALRQCALGGTSQIGLGVYCQPQPGEAWFDDIRADVR